MNNFLRTGQKSSGDNNSIKGETEQNDADDDVKMDCDGGESSALAESKLITSNQPKIPIDIDNVLRVIETSESVSETAASGSTSRANAQPQSSDTEANCCNNKMKTESNKRGLVTGPDPTKPLQPKAKVLRQQRKAAKQLANGDSLNAAATDAIKVAAVPKEPKNVAKNLKSFVDEAPMNGKHKLKAGYNFRCKLYSFLKKKKFFALNFR